MILLAKKILKEERLKFLKNFLILKLFSSDNFNRHSIFLPFVTVIRD